ncbi:MAG: lipid-A-disaccharide synthase [Acidobacteria bacterium]|nr:lipid-A-disaccharide synthase [Acidobacteriota bacterium]
MRILISAGEASGDLYASLLAAELRRRLPDTEFFGCTGPRMRAAGIETVVDAASLNVVGIVEVVRHIPRIHGEFRKLVAAAEQRKPDLAILTDSPDFHLRLAPKLRRMGIPVVYLIAPQAWAWRKGRIPAMRRDLSLLLCIFPFEEAFFRGHGVRATYIGHPLTRIVRPSMSRVDFFRKHGLPLDRPLITLLPGSRPGEVARHLRVLPAAAEEILKSLPASFVMATPAGLRPGLDGRTIHAVDGETWDAIAHADLAIAASGTVTVETAILGTPMIAYYRVSEWTWRLGRHLVNVPFFSMVNLIAERRLVPELIQPDCTPGRIAAEALHLLRDPAARDSQRRGLAEVTARLATDSDPAGRAADAVLSLAGLHF